MAAEAPPAVRLLGVAKGFGRGAARVEALAPLDLDLEAGRTTALVGPSGCGKSTLLRLLSGLEAPDAGEIRIGGEAPDAVRREGAIAMAFQDPALLPWRTARGNVALGRSLAGLPRDGAAVDALLALVGLEGFEARRPGELSGGMRQRVAIARALSGRPRLLLLDEPFGAVDEITRARLHADLAPLWEGRTTALLVTHSVAEAVRLADRVLVMTPRPGRIAADIPIPLPRPRGEGIGEARVHALRDAVSAALRGLDAVGLAAQ